jgi:hypothetical protein
MQQEVVIPYQHFRTTYRSHLHQLRLQKKTARNCSMGFVQGRVWAMISLSSMMPASRGDADDRREGEV